MKKHYIIFVLAMIPLALHSQTVNTVKDTLSVAFFADYTTIATSSGVTLTLSLSENEGNIADIQGVEIYRNFKYNRIKDRVRIATGLSGSSGTVVFSDNFSEYTRNESNMVSGYDGSGAYPVGEVASYSVAVIMNDTDNTKFSSSRTIQSVYIPNFTTPDANIIDDVNADMKLWTRVYTNLNEEYAILAIGLQPSTTYPNNPYKLYQDAIIARTGGDIDWSAQPCYTDVYFSSAATLDGRVKMLNDPTAFGGSPSVIYHRFDKADIPVGQIDTEGKTYVSLKFARPNATQPANGFTYGSTLTIPVQITSSTASVNDKVLANFSVYPNPSNGTVNIKGDKLIEEVKVYNIMGKSILTQNNVNNNSTIMDFTNNASGIYFAKIKTEVGTTTRKIIIK
tara:strand:+ start:17407 stop:18591 length:1185 start_codon:yes stop_codon:yes gene_type:complete